MEKGVCSTKPIQYNHVIPVEKWQASHSLRPMNAIVEEQKTEKEGWHLMVK